MNSTLYLISFNVLPEPKLEPKLAKSVAFLLGTDFQYTKTKKSKNRKTEEATEKVKPKTLNRLQNVD